MMIMDLRAQWFPVAAGGDLPFRHVYHAELLGQELAVWRADDGYVNAWENRCLHRGVRLTLGNNLGDALKCQYHGWTYASRTSGCTYIPAHPENAPARLICNKVFPAVERYGLVWSRLEGDDSMDAIAELEGTSPLALRGIPVKVSAARVVDALAGDGAERLSDFMLRLRDIGLVLLVQPVNDARSIIRGVVHGVAEADRIAVLRHHNDRLSGVRDRVEAQA